MGSECLAVGVDYGHWGHPVRLLCLRADLTPGSVARFGS
jgi:hypothetical protein